MSGQWIDRVVVVLVRARNPNNIGAVARAMHDFGFRHLRVVNEYAVPFEAARSAVDASEVLAGRQSSIASQARLRIAPWWWGRPPWESGHCSIPCMSCRERRR